MEAIKLPYQKASYFLAILSCIFFFFGGIAIVLALTSFILIRKAERLHQNNPDNYSNFKKFKKAKVIAIIGIVLNLIILGITIWTLYTIGWEAWSEEFMRKWNEGLESGRASMN